MTISLIAENRWRAQRYGVREGLIDFGAHQIIPFAQAIDEIIELISEDAEALGCMAEVEHARTILDQGTSSDRQRAVFEDALEAEYDRDEALKRVVRHLIDDFHADL